MSDLQPIIQPRGADFLNYVNKVSDWQGISQT